MWKIYLKIRLENKREQIGNKKMSRNDGIKINLYNGSK